ncbi:DUF3800 domain-containing protein [Pontiellaceae bacterium B12219]|nr:DUF3800 domain-containing protein [Pontiellaceae bacterium B12219]
MHFIYFDENKYSEESPFFHIGGIMVPEEKLLPLENVLARIQHNFFGSSVLIKDTEIHGKELWHRKGVFKKRKASERIQLLEDLASVVIEHKIPVQLVTIDVQRHKTKYRYPEPEYRLGLMLFLERVCDHLDKNSDYGMVFGDYEKDEVARSIVDFSQFKMQGATEMYFGRNIDRLIDTIYFTQSHHSRLLQLADVMVYLAGRFNRMTEEPEKWMEQKGLEIWNTLKQGTDLKIQEWP